MIHFLVPQAPRGETKEKKNMGDITQVQDGDIVVRTVTNASTAMLHSRKGSVTINEKIDENSNLTIRAAKNVSIGQKIDQHSNPDIVAGGSVEIGRKIDQYSVARIVAQTGNINIGQKVDQHNTAFLSAPAGNIVIGEGINQHSIVITRRKERSSVLSMAVGPLTRT